MIFKIGEIIGKGRQPGRVFSTDDEATGVQNDFFFTVFRDVTRMGGKNCIKNEPSQCDFNDNPKRV